MEVKRINVSANTITEFKFNVLACDFLVKNFTDGSILVCLAESFNEENAIKIPSMAFEEVFNLFDEKPVKYSREYQHKLFVKADVEGEVEVRCLK